MEKFEVGQIVRLKSWEKLVPIKQNLPSVHEEMWQQCQDDFVIDSINEEGYFKLQINERTTWIIAPWMCEVSEKQGVEPKIVNWEDILNGTK